MTTQTLSQIIAEQPEGPDGYTTEPTHVRLWADRAANDGRIIEWGIDGADDDGNYTEKCWTYDTREQALAEIAEFIESATLDGVTWHWRTPRNALAEVA